ncbi:MAG: two-component system, cell cycle sensor histidine kinase and response regulator CckA [Solirubrobacteraceae bacterium]|nr:two-component system, cell cycle sensor histidine kinase and response regulator CckA [Solirubrobacteraceae bacterium]
MPPDSDTRATDLERRLFDLAGDPLVISTPEGELIRVNAAACALAGRSEEELLARSLGDVVHPSDHAALAAQREEFRRTGAATTSARFRIIRPDGSCRWAESSVTRDPETGVLFSVVRDITGRESVELERLTALFDHAPLGMALMTPDGALQRVNLTLATMLGFSETELLERTIFEVLDDEDSVDALGRALGGTQEAFQAEVRLRRSDDRAVIALFGATLVTNMRREPVHFVCQVLDITERAEAQERLEMNEAKLAEAQQIARLGSWEWEIGTDRVTWSEELYRIYGVRADRFSGSYGSNLDRVHADDRARVARVIENAVAERRPWSIDYRIVRPDGELRMIHARGEVVCDEQGRPAVVQGTCQDVTESRRVEDALRAAEQLFRRAFDDAPIGMALIDLEGRWLRLNRAICQMLVRSEQELRTMRLTELNHPDDRRLDRPLVKELLSGRRRSFALEKRYVHADGQLIHALVHVSLMHGDGERPLYFLCQLVDITERRRAEAERRAAQERMQAIIDNSPALVIVKDLEQRYLLVNRRWEDLFGMPVEDVLGRTSDEVLGDRASGQEDLDREVIATGEVREAMATIGEDEAETTFLVVKFPLRDADGQTYAVCTIATDITERRRSAEERAELETRLAQAQRLESVGQLAGGVAHDFNNLLSVILTCVGFAQRELPGEHPVREDVEEIGRAADRAAALTRQLLMFSRREVVTPQVVDVGALVREIERLLNRTLSERVALRISIGPDVVPVLIDPAQLEQVLVNLAVNARDAMPQGGTLSIAVSGASGGVRVTVADDGGGMPPEVRERAFEPFFTTKEAGEGTGLGLATVHGVVTDAGGTVDIESEVGGGTVVAIFLPATADGAVLPEEPATPGERALGDASVLVVEDQDPVRRQACRILEAHGYRVRDAAGADEALAAWEPVDVLVTDVVMPGMSGQQLAERARERAPGLRVVFMSGHTDDVLVREGARQGDIAFVQKPFTRDSLLRAVEEAMAQPAPAARP